MNSWLKLSLTAAALSTPAAIQAGGTQNPVDRSDPSVAAEELRESERRTAPISTDPPPPAAPAPAANASFDPFVIGAIQIEGAKRLPPEAFAAAVEPYLGRLVGAEDLALLARDVGDVARRAGYGLASASIPPQSVENGVLRVHVDEGRIDAVEVEGAAREIVERRLAPLIDGEPVLTAKLERQLLIAGDVAGVSLGRARLVRNSGRNILHVASSRQRASARAAVDNWGSGPVGPVQARLSLDLHGVAAADDRLSIGGVVTPLQPKEFQLLHAAYSRPIGAGGTEARLRGYVGHTNPGGILADHDFTGLSYEAEAGISHPLVRSRAESLWVVGSFGLRDSRLEQAGTPVRDDRIAAASVALHAAGHIAGGHARFRLGLVQGLDLFGATERGDPLASRPDASGVFRKLQFSGRYDRALGRRLSLSVAGEGQLADGPLLASEEIGLGGRDFLRAFDYRERSGDSGVAASAELRMELPRLPGPLERTQVYAYGDAGRVRNIGGGYGDGSLASAGGGVRIWLKPRISAGVEIGVPIAEAGADGSSNPRISFQTSTAF